MKEKAKANESVILKDVLLEYEEVIKAAKEKLAENNSKELNSIIEKFLKESDNKNEPFNKAGKEVAESTSIQKPIGETVKEGFDAQAINMKEASLSEVEAAFDNANSEDEFQVVRSADQGPADAIGNEFDLTSIESEIDEMMQQVNQAELQMQQANQNAAPAQAQAPASAVVAASPSNDPMSKMKEMYEGMGKFIKEMEDMSNNQAMMNEFHSKMTEMYGESYKAQMDEAKIGELFSMYKKVKGGNAGEPTNKMNETQPVAVAEETAPVAAAPAVEEGHGIAMAHNRLVGQEQQPRIENGKEYAANKIRAGLRNESAQKKLTALLKENQNLMKQLNKTKSALSESQTKATEVESIKKLNEGNVATLDKYKGALEKYRAQLKEMAVLNTNISYVNSLFLNENLSLSMKDKEAIIEKFKKVGNIVESEQTYKALLKSLTESKQTLKESIEDKVNSTIVEASSAKVLEESVKHSSPEAEHINKILKYSGIK